MSSDKKTGAERRQHRRFQVVDGMIEPITLEMEGVESANKKVPAIMTDLSAGGMSLLMFIEPPHAKTFQMTLSVPGLEDVAIQASVARVHQKGETFSVGLSFVKIPKDAQKRIEKMAEDSADCETRTALRLPDACGPDCPFHSLFSPKAKAARQARR
ncbi:MAG TPA: PilZ domain-containing protein [Elusimicrobiota bacterium]|nr:PilZ domain-containing protein [Elusimicrobiota bacterium]